jgi:predicted Zn-dependent protease
MKYTPRLPVSEVNVTPRSALKEFVLNITEMSFSRGQETAADEFGLDVLQCAYGHTAGATDFFRKIPTSQNPGRFGHYFASHPENQRRISHIEALIGQKGYETGEKKPVGDFAKTP